MNVRLCDAVLGNLRRDTDTFSLLSREIDYFEIRWWELDRRALCKATARGQLIRMLLPLGQYLAEGDVLADDGTTLVVVTVLPCQVLVVQLSSAAQMGRVALEVGNLHAPAQVCDNEILIAPDGPVEAALNRLGVAYHLEQRLFHPQRCAGAPTLQVAADFVVHG